MQPHFPGFSRDPHPVAAAAVARFMSALDAALPGHIVELHVVGSVALDDFVPGRCDLDFVAVTDGSSTGLRNEALSRLHEMLMVPLLLDGIYVARDDWDRASGWPSGPAVQAGRFEALSAYRRRPIDRLALADHALTLRGTPPVARPDVDEVTTWAVAALHDLQDHHDPDAADEAMLAVCRLHYLLATGRIPSKSAAALYGLITFEGRWRRILDEALRLRRSPDTSSLYQDADARQRDALAFIRMAATDALSLA